MCELKLNNCRHGTSIDWRMEIWNILFIRDILNMWVWRGNIWTRHYWCDNLMWGHFKPFARRLSKSQIFNTDLLRTYEYCIVNALVILRLLYYPPSWILLASTLRGCTRFVTWSRRVHIRSCIYTFTFFLLYIKTKTLTCIVCKWIFLVRVW